MSRLSSKSPVRASSFSVSLSFLLTLHVTLMLAYVFFMPAFEGADEPDHLRYIEALTKGETIHPVDESDPRRHGIEVYQPPLYYQLAALAGRVFPVAFPDHLAINPDKNPNRPFLVHDEPGAFFPFDPPRRALRLFRILSLLSGILSFLVLARILHMMMPENREAATVILLVAALWPNYIQTFSVVSNDGLAYLFGLCLILCALYTVRAKSPSWKYGVMLGVALGLGLLTKMTILLTLAALCPALVVDVVLDRPRLRGYLKMLPALLLSLAVISGPFIISRLHWYGSFTGESLHNILVPSVIRQTAISFATVMKAMVVILPGRFLADLCWQQLTVPFVSLQFFLIWFFLNLSFGTRMIASVFKNTDRQTIVHQTMVLSAFVFMFIGLYHVSAHYIHMQIRHVWGLWPLTLLAPYFAFKGLKRLGRINRPRLLGVISAALMMILVPVNLLIVYNFILMYRPAEEISSPDGDYYTFIDCFAQSPYKANAYTDPTGTSDVLACRYYMAKGDWENVLFHARRASEKGAPGNEAHLFRVLALKTMGRPQDALDILRERGDPSHESRILEAEVLVDLERFTEARKAVEELLVEAPRDYHGKLQALLQEIDSKAFLE